MDKIIVLDNQSTDDSRSLFAPYENILVKSYDTGGEYREDVQTGIRNTIWKKSRGHADYVIVCDLDEFLYVKDPDHFFGYLRSQKITVVRPLGFDMVSLQLPVQGRQIYDQIKEGVRNPQFDKMIFFDPNQIEEINFSPGSHLALPEGYVKILKRNDKIKLLHYRYLSEEYILKKWLLKQCRSCVPRRLYTPTNLPGRFLQ